MENYKLIRSGSFLGAAGSKVNTGLWNYEIPAINPNNRSNSTGSRQLTAACLVMARSSLLPSGAQMALGNPPVLHPGRASHARKITK